MRSLYVSVLAKADAEKPAEPPGAEALRLAAGSARSVR